MHDSLLTLACDSRHYGVLVRRCSFLLGQEVVRRVKRWTGTPLTWVLIPGAARDFSPGANFHYRLSYVCPYTPCAIACIHICVHVGDPVVHVRVRWIMKTLKHPACPAGWVARLCCSWLSPGKAARISHGRNPSGTIQLLKKKY